MNNGNLVHKNREYLIKQSEMLQALIGRMASSSLTIKQLGLTIWTTLIGFGFTNKNKSLFLLALLSFVLLGFLDSYYLYLERRFRNNFEILTELICGLDSDEEETLKRFKGNFLKLEKLKPMQLKKYYKALKSWANFIYIIVSVATLIILLIN